MCSFELLIHLLQKNHTKYYKTIGAPNLKNNVFKGVRDTLKLLVQLQKGVPEKFPSSSICIKLAKIYRVSVSYFIISLTPLAIAAIALVIKNN
jgi:hypothetical protein